MAIWSEKARFCAVIWVTSALLRIPHRHKLQQAYYLLPSPSSRKTTETKEALVQVAMTGVKGFKTQKVILRCNQLPNLHMDAQPGAQLQIR